MFRSVKYPCPWNFKLNPEIEESADVTSINSVVSVGRRAFNVQVHHSHLSFAYPGNYFYKLVRGTLEINTKIKPLEQLGLWNLSQSWELPSRRGAIPLLDGTNIEVRHIHSSCKCAVTLCCFTVFPSYLITVWVLKVLCRMLVSPRTARLPLQNQFWRVVLKPNSLLLWPIQTSRCRENRPCTVIILSFANTALQEDAGWYFPTDSIFLLHNKKKTLVS